jgi:hypothetical protein
MTCTSSRVVLLSSVAMAMASVSAVAAPLVTNGSFETGDLTGWTAGASYTTNALASVGVWSARSGCVDAGCVTLGAGGVSGTGVLSQAIDLDGGVYRLTYDHNNASGGVENRFAVSLGTNLLRNSVNAGSSGDFLSYENITAVSGGSTTLAFGVRHEPSYQYVDNIALVQIDDGEGNNIAAVSQSVAFQGTFGFLDRIQNRFGRAGSPVSVALNTPVDVADNSGGYISPTGSMRAHISGYGDRGKWDEGIKSRRWGLSAGVETAVADSLDVGVTLSAGHSRFTTETIFTDNTGRADEYLGAIHAHFSPKSVPLYLTAAAGYGYTSTDFTRASALDGTVVARGVEATQWLGSVELGFDWKLGKSFTLTPYLRGDAARLDQDGYTETVLSVASLLPMTVEAVEQDAARTVLGARGTFDIAAGKRGARLTMGAGWAHEFETDRAVAFGVTSPTIGAGGTDVLFAGTTSAATPAEDSVVAGASVEAPVSDEARIYVGYNGLFASGNDSHGAEAGLRVVW